MADLPIPTGTSRCPACGVARAPRIQFDHGWVWSCTTFECVLKEIAGIFDRCQVQEPKPVQMNLWGDAA